MLLLQGEEEELNRLDRNGYKVRAFRQAIKLIKELDRPIGHSADVAQVRVVKTFSRVPCIDVLIQIKGIGPGIRRRIQAFLDGEPLVSNRVHCLFVMVAKSYLRRKRKLRSRGNFGLL